MSSQLSTIVCIILGIISWYYFNKFLESEREYSKLHKRFDNLHMENQKMRTRVKDLQSYKTDVSKTFQILDNELIMINDHLQKRNDRGSNPIRNAVSNANVGQQQSIPFHTTIQTSRIPLTRISSFASMPSTNNVSLLTPELLTSLFNMNTEDLRQPPQQQPQQQNTQQQNIQVNDTNTQQQNTQQQLQQLNIQVNDTNTQQQQNTQTNETNETNETNIINYVTLQGEGDYRENILEIDDTIEENHDKNIDEREDKYDGGLHFRSSYDISAENSGYDQYLLNN